MAVTPTPPPGTWTAPWAATPPPVGAPPAGAWNSPPMFTPTGNVGLDYANSVLNPQVGAALSQATAPWPPAPPAAGVPPMSGPPGAGGPSAPRSTFPDSMSTDGGKTTKSGLSMDDINKMLGQPAGSPVSAQQMQALTTQLQQDPKKVPNSDIVTKDANKMQDLQSFGTYMQTPATGGGKTVTNVGDITSKADADGKGGSGITSDEICAAAGAPAGTPISQEMLKKAYGKINQDPSVLNGKDQTKALEDLGRIDKEKLGGSGILGDAKNTFTSNKDLLNYIDGDHFEKMMTTGQSGWLAGQKVDTGTFDQMKKIAGAKVGDDINGEKVTQKDVDAAKAMTSKGDNKDGMNDLAYKVFGDDGKAWLRGNHIGGSESKNNEVGDLAKADDVNSKYNIGLGTGSSGSSGSSGSK